MDFYIKKHTESARFKPHYNSSMGKYYHTKDDYKADLKKHNLEPYRGEVKRNVSKPYTPSKEAHQFVESIKRNTDKDGNVHLSGNQRKFLAERLSSKPTDKLRHDRGGFE